MAYYSVGSTSIGALMDTGTNNNGTIQLANNYSIELYIYGSGKIFSASVIIGTSGTPNFLAVVNEVPEPSAWSMMFLGLGMLGFCLRRKSA